MIDNKIIFLFSINFLTITFSNHVFARSSINRHYEHAKLALSIHQKREVPIDQIEKNLPKETVNSDETSLTAYEPITKILTREINPRNNETFYFLSTMINGRLMGERLWFYPDTFKEIIAFFYGNQQTLLIDANDVIYDVSRHSSSDLYFHLTILQKTPIYTQNQTQSDEYKLSGIFLTIGEYKNLLDRSNQIFKEIESIEDDSL